MAKTKNNQSVEQKDERSELVEVVTNDIKRKPTKYRTIHSAEPEYINTIAKQVFKFSADNGIGGELKERYNRFMCGKEVDYAEAGFFAKED